jgi:hypothetical protein
LAPTRQATLISYEQFAQILGFGEEDLGRPKLHGGEFPLDSEMAFMYDSMFGKVEFGTTHGMKPVYRMLNQLSAIPSLLRSVTTPTSPT